MVIPIYTVLPYCVILFRSKTCSRSLFHCVLLLQQAPIPTYMYMYIRIIVRTELTEIPKEKTYLLKVH